MKAEAALVIAITAVALFAGSGVAQYANRSRATYTHGHPYVPHPCEKSSCYPATGNLLIGRESKLFASSTCGLANRERYCIVSHLKDRKKCFWCETRPETEKDSALNHGVANIIYRFRPGTKQRTWWQSRNGVENVTLQLDLEAEFHFTHLIIVFKTFRPAAMLVERSFDFGKTWRVYRYFAHKCDEAFPGIPTHTPRVLTDVVCESKYSSVAPSMDGEIIFRVLPPNIVISHPYSQEVQNLLKMTNLRIIFTKLHTLGDDLLDDRAEIQEKYYYAITEMTVRGSCSCYGHASRCLPLPGVESKTDMVHGRCECTHNTKGLNCELCEDFFNDLPWKPALGQTTNACKRCSCNNHATSCHFDAAVYELTAKVSGGVCDDCQHNTMGRNCERCKEYYYHDPELDIQDPEACKPCDCDPRGSVDDAICDPETDTANNQEAGKCHCKTNVEGRRCDSCKNGFWDFSESNPDGCRECTCNALGTVDNRGCDVYTGECTCKRYVTGRDCNQCLPEFYGLSEDEEGCKPCDCDVGGSLDNSCDVITGQCSCRPHVQGRKCDQPIQHHFSGALDHLVYEAEESRCASGLDDNSINSNCQVITREPFRDGRVDTWTGTGYMKVFEDNYLEFIIDNIKTSMDYDILIRYEPQMQGAWEQVLVELERPDGIGDDSPCANSMPRDDTTTVILPDNARSVFVEPSVCLESGKEYILKISFDRQKPEMSNTRANVLIDSIALIPKMISLPFFNDNTQVAEARRLDFQKSRCDDAYYFSLHNNEIPEVCKQYHTSIGFYVFNGALSCQCDPTGSISYKCEEYGGRCPCKPNVVGQRCNRCAPGTYGFSPEGCKACDCNNIGALDNFCDANSGQCKCRPNTYGRQCDECQPGYWNFPSCQQCDCNGHADKCQSKNGTCIDCRDYTEGHRCDRCTEGYYGDPRLGYDIPCRACPCPGTRESSHSFASRCSLDPYTKDVICECEEGYAGSRCDVCADNYFGHPELPGGSCTACDCSNNIDITKPLNCDLHTGKCLQCLYDTAGDKCDVCKEGFYGDALDRTCTECDCEILGTNSSAGACDRETGQCPCYNNVIGLECDQCSENHWRLASGEGCDACDCDQVGSVSEQCNVYDGQCICKEGFGGRRCDQCQSNFWGNPNEECFPCKCDPTGSASRQCVRETGACVCLPGIGGYNCDQCARGFIGESPICRTCGECFDNWDRIISELFNQTNLAIDNARKIKIVGATGAYTSDFEEMENSLNRIETLVNSTVVGTTQLNNFDAEMKSLSEKLGKANGTVSNINDEHAEAVANIAFAKSELDDLIEQTKNLNEKSIELDQNATKLQEANLEGALNLTREAKQRAMKAADDADSVQIIIGQSERQIKGTESLIERQYNHFNNMQKENDKELSKLNDKLLELESQIPELNYKMCGQTKNTDVCDVCGGVTCDTCGGLLCERGAMTKADKALNFANETDVLLRQQESKAEELLRAITTAKRETTAAREAAQNTADAAIKARNITDHLTKESSEVTRDMEHFLSNTGATPTNIRTYAKDIMDMKIDLLPEQITNLANEINSTVSQLTDIDSIIEETKADLLDAEQLERRAVDAKMKALATVNTTDSVKKALEEAESAQQLAEEAILKANEDIEAAKRDLTPIGRETDDAHKKANDTMSEVEGLLFRLQTLQKNILEIDSEAKLVKDETNDVVLKANEAQQQARELRKQYQTANASLAQRVEQSANSRERAQLLLSRASQLATDTQTQLKQLQNMEDLYNSYTLSLSKLEKHIDGLNAQITHYLNEITRKSDSYRLCTV